MGLIANISKELVWKRGGISNNKEGGGRACIFNFGNFPLCLFVVYIYKMAGSFFTGIFWNSDQKFSRNIFTPSSTCTYQGVRSVNFLENTVNLLNGWLLIQKSELLKDIKGFLKRTPIVTNKFVGILILTIYLCKVFSSVFRLIVGVEMGFIKMLPGNRYITHIS